MTFEEALQKFGCPITPHTATIADTEYEITQDHIEEACEYVNAKQANVKYQSIYHRGDELELDPEVWYAWRAIRNELNTLRNQNKRPNPGTDDIRMIEGEAIPVSVLHAKKRMKEATAEYNAAIRDLTVQQKLVLKRVTFS